MKKKLLSILLSATMAVAMLAGCGNSSSQSTPAQDPAPAPTETPSNTETPANNETPAESTGGTLVYWSMWEATEPQAQVIQAAVDKYMADTGVTVDLQFKGRTGQREGLEAALAAGQQIDIFDEDVDRVNGTWGSYLMDLESLVAETGYEQKASPALMQIARDVAGGTLKSIPYQASVFAFFYNQDLFDQAGITAVPTTWSEFLDVCQKLKDAGIVPITCDDAYIDCMIGYHLGRLGGEDKVVDIVTNGKWDDPIVKQMAEDYEELASKGYFSPNLAQNVWPAGQNTELALGGAAMYLNGSWLPNEVKNMTGPDFRWGCFSYPAVDGGVDGPEALNVSNQVLAINKDSKMAKEAFNLITYITQGEFDAMMAEQAVSIPTDTTNTTWPKLMANVKPVYEGITAEGRYSWAVGVESNNDITPIIKENFTKLCAGSMTAQEFVDAMIAASK